MVEKSFCIGCSREHGDKNLCIGTCERRTEYQEERRYSCIGVPTKSSQDVDKDELCIVCKKVPSEKRDLCMSCHRKWYAGLVSHPTLGAWRKMTGPEVTESRRRKKKAIVIELAKKVAMADERIKERKTRIKERETKMKEQLKKQLKEGKKDSEGKTDWSFLPMDSLEGVARVFEKGSDPKEYDGRRTWLPGIMFGKLFAATMRHLFDWFYKKKDQDDKTGEHPLCHVIANCMMLLTFITNNDYDDRG